MLGGRMQAGRWQPLDACVEVDISHTEDFLTVVALREVGKHFARTPLNPMEQRAR